MLKLKFGKGIIEVPCGNCLSCRLARSREWSVRILHEMTYHKKSCFATLTYSDECLPLDNSLSKDVLQKFFKRLRKEVDKKNVKLKYYACGEYGDAFGRPHYHAIIFGLGLQDRKTIADAWGFGFVKLGTVTYQSARYVANYIQKKYNGRLADQTYGDKQIPFQLCSQGLGKSWALDNEENLRENLGTTIEGTEVGLPRYYRKVLGITSEDLAKKALDSKKEVEDYYYNLRRVTPAEFGISRYAAREQSELTVLARANLYKKGNL